MSLKISKGPRIVPVRGILAGTSGIGKSTFAAGLPRPLFLDTEESTNQLDVDRIIIRDWAHLQVTVAELAGTKLDDYSTIIIDTADWAERMLVEHMLAKSGKKSIEDWGFGKGYTVLAEEFGRFLSLCDGLISKGYHVVFVAHTKVVRVSPPDQTDGYDRYELKMSKQVGPLLKEWADLMLFAHTQITIVEGTDGRIKAQGGKDRVMHTSSASAWDAKNRFGLADTLPFDPVHVADVFAGKIARVITLEPAQLVHPAEVAKQDARPEQAPSPITEEQLSKITIYNGNSVGREVIAKALNHYGEAALDLLNTEQAAKIITRCQEAMNKATDKPAKALPAPETDAAPAFLWPSAFEVWLSAHEVEINKYLVGIKWLSAGQTYRDITCERGDKIVSKPDAVARAARIPTIGEKEAA